MKYFNYKEDKYYPNFFTPKAYKILTEMLIELSDGTAEVVGLETPMGKITFRINRKVIKSHKDLLTKL